MNCGTLLPVLISVLITVSCSMAPARKDADVKQRVPETWQPVETRISREDVPVENWWHVFNDASLNTLIEKAIENNLDIHAAIERITMYGSQFDMRRGARYPAVNASSGYSWAKQPIPAVDVDFSQNPPDIGQKTTSETNHNYSLNMGLRFDLDIWGRLHHLEKAAVAQLKKSRSDLETLYLAVISQVILNYWDIVALNEKLSITAESISTYEDQLAVMREKYAAGLTAHVNVEMSRQSLQQARTAEEQFQQQRDIALNNIAALTGTYPGQLHDAVDFAEKLPAPDTVTVPDSVPSDLLKDRHDIVAAEHAMEGARQMAGYAKADLFPAIGINLNGGYQIQEITKLFSWKHLAASIGADAAQVVFAGGSKLAALDEKRSVFRQAVLSYEKTVLHAYRDVGNAMVTLRSARIIRQRIESLAKSSASVHRETERRYISGLTTWDRVISTGQAMLNTENALTDSRKGYLIAVVNIYRNLGGAWVTKNTGRDNTTAE